MANYMKLTTMEEDLFGPLSGKPVVRLPPVTAGVINFTAVTRLQDELEETRCALRRTEQKLEEETTNDPSDEKVKELLQSLSKRNLTLKGIMNEGIKKEVAAQTEELGQMLEEARGTSQARGEEQAEKLSDGQVRELLTQNPTVKTLLARITKKVDQQVEEKTQQIKAEYEEKLRLANVDKSRAVLEEKKTGLRLAMTESKLWLADAKLARLEKCKNASPTMQAQHILQKVWAVKVSPTTPQASIAPQIARTNSATELQHSAKGTCTLNSPFCQYQGRSPWALAVEKAGGNSQLGGQRGTGAIASLTSATSVYVGGKRLPEGENDVERPTKRARGEVKNEDDLKNKNLSEG